MVSLRCETAAKTFAFAMVGAAVRSVPKVAGPKTILAVDKPAFRCYDTKKFIKTDEAGGRRSSAHRESGELGSGQYGRPSHGPLRARGKDHSKYGATRRHALVAGDVLASRKGHGSYREARWHRESFIRP